MALQLRPLGIDLLDDVLDEAAGRGHRRDPVGPRTGGPAGNAQLTSWAGLVLLALIAAELVTLLDVIGLVRWHVGIGVAMTALVLLKTGSTSWRILRYYARSAGYRSAGPPPLLLRLLGPLVIGSTLGVLGSGIALIAVGADGSRRTWFTVLGRAVDLVTLHQLFFILFAVFTGLHLLARFLPAVALARGRLREPVGEGRRLPGRGGRVAVLAAGCAAAVLGVVLILPATHGWQNEHRFHDGGPGATRFEHRDGG